MWQAPLQQNYSNFEEWEHSSENYGIAQRLGFKDAQEAWEVNPLIQGLENREDYTVVPVNKMIKLPCHKIVVYLFDNNAGVIFSNLTGNDPWEDKDGIEVDLLAACLDTVESFILASACAGIDIEKPAFLEAIETTVDAVLKNNEDR